MWVKIEIQNANFFPKSSETLCFQFCSKISGSFFISSKIMVLRWASRIGGITMGLCLRTYSKVCHNIQYSSARNSVIPPFFNENIVIKKTQPAGDRITIFSVGWELSLLKKRSKNLKNMLQHLQNAKFRVSIFSTGRKIEGKTKKYQKFHKKCSKTVELSKTSSA